MLFCKDGKRPDTPMTCRSAMERVSDLAAWKLTVTCQLAEFTELCLILGHSTIFKCCTDSLTKNTENAINLIV